MRAGVSPKHEEVHKRFAAALGRLRTIALDSAKTDGFAEEKS